MPLKSKYKGVTIRPFGQKKYFSMVTHKGIKYYCGTYYTEMEAVKARDLKIIRLNLPVATQVIKKLNHEKEFG
jgi:hypothetical protein